MLQVVFDGLLRSTSCAFTKTPVIDHNYVIVVTGEIHGKLAPTFDGPGIPFEIKDHALGILYTEMGTIDFGIISYVYIVLPVLLVGVIELKILR